MKGIVLFFILLQLIKCAKSSQISYVKRSENDGPIKVSKFDNLNISLPDVSHSNGRIIGGRDAEVGEATFIFSLQPYNHICGGSILNKRWLITAAHCVDRRLASDLKIRYNSLNNEIGGNESSIIRIVIHPSFESFSFDNDIALLQTASDLILGDKQANSIELPAEGYDPEIGSIVQVMGWGYTEDGSLPEHLKIVEVPIIFRSQCNEQYLDVMPITDNMFCAGVAAGGKDSCKGDSGGPLVKDGVLWGLVSWGYWICGLPNRAGVYTRVSNYIHWIKLHID